MKKTYVLDTCVMLHDSNCINVFEENDIVIPFTALEELDRFKKNEDETGRNARAISRQLDQYRDKGSLIKGIDLENGGTLRISGEYSDPQIKIDMKVNDNKILGTAVAIKNSILVTNDINLRIKADSCGIPAQGYANKRVRSIKLYSGVNNEELEVEEFAAFKKRGWIECSKERAEREGYYPNEYFVLRKKDSEKKVLARYSKCQNRIVKLDSIQGTISGIKSLNDEQRFALDALLNDEIKLVTLVGKAGTGKTLVSIAAGIHKMGVDDTYNKMLVARPVEPMGKDLGYLPGDIKEKLAPWMKPIYDNIEFLLSITDKKGSHIRSIADEKIEIEALTYIRGRSIPQQYMVIDESQNLTPHEIKTIVTRAGEGTKIVFTGDTQQIDSPYLDESSNGLVYCLERMKILSLSAHVTLTKGERSALAEAGSNIL